eukprot:RCo043254
MAEDEEKRRADAARMAEVLLQLHLEEHVESFTSGEVTVETLWSMEEKDWKELLPKLGHRVKLQAWLKSVPREVRGPAAAVPPTGEELLSAHQNLGVQSEDEWGSVKVQVRVWGVDIVPPLATFDDFVRDHRVKKNLTRVKFRHPTPAQKHAMGCYANGRDFIISAQTGTGKTGAFVIPIVELLLQENADTAILEPRRPLALLLEPTRELAQQTANEVTKFSSGTSLRVLPVICRMSRFLLDRRLNEGVHIVVATTGRLSHALAEDMISLERLRYVVLDEADRLFEQNNSLNSFRTQEMVHSILEALPRPCHIAAFSATIPDEVRDLAETFMTRDLYFKIGEVLTGCNPRITQVLLYVQPQDKQLLLVELLRKEVPLEEQVMVFTNVKEDLQVVAALLERELPPVGYWPGGHRPNVVRVLSAEMEPRAREDAIRDFRGRQCRVLVTTDLASRGLDFPDLKFVIQYDLPRNLRDYIHRVGRTGRLFKEGKAFTFFNHRENFGGQAFAQQLLSLLRENHQTVPDFLGCTPDDTSVTSRGGNRWSHPPAAERCPPSDALRPGGGYARQSGSRQTVSVGSGSCWWNSNGGHAASSSSSWGQPRPRAEAFDGPSRWSALNRGDPSGAPAGLSHRQQPRHAATSSSWWSGRSPGGGAEGPSETAPQWNAAAMGRPAAPPVWRQSSGQGSGGASSSDAGSSIGVSGTGGSEGPFRRARADPLPPNESLDWGSGSGDGSMDAPKEPEKGPCSPVVSHSDDGMSGPSLDNGAYSSAPLPSPSGDVNANGMGCDTSERLGGTCSAVPARETIHSRQRPVAADDPGCADTNGSSTAETPGENPDSLEWGNDVLRS